MTIVRAGDVDLWVEQTGSGPDVVFIAGLGDDASCWAEQARGLSDAFRVTTFDNRAVGKSSTPPGDYQITDFARDTAALLDDLQIKQAHVVGSSMGGAIAQELTLARPDLVGTLVLHGTWCETDRHFAEVINGWKHLARAAQSRRDFFINVNVWFLKPQLYNDGTIDEWASVYDADQHPQTVDAFCRSADALLGHNTRARLHDIECPTLITVGSLDICTPVRYAHDLHDLIPNSTLHIFDDAGHMPYVEDPHEFTTRIWKFIDEATRAKHDARAVST